MKVALYSLNKSINELFIETLFSKGITVYSSEDIKEFVAIVLNKPVYCLFIDIDISGVDWIKLIELLKTKKAPKNLFIVIMTASTDKTFLNELILLGINAVFDKKKSLKGYINKIEKLLLLFESDMIDSEGKEKRKYVRIRIRAEENIKVNIEMAGKEHMGYFICRALDLSVVAVAFHIEDNRLLKLVNHKAKKINNLQLVITKKVYFCEGEIIRSKGSIAVARFLNTSNMFTLGIANFIYKKLNT